MDSLGFCGPIRNLAIHVVSFVTAEHDRYQLHNSPTYILGLMQHDAPPLVSAEVTVDPFPSERTACCFSLLQS